MPDRHPAIHRWTVAAAATFGMMAAFGVATSVAVLVRPFEAEFGWSRADIAFAYSLLSVGAALGGLVAGRTIDLVNARFVVTFGAMVLGLGLVALSRQDSLAAVQHVYLVTGVFGFACLYTPLVTTVGLWFERGRGLAIGIVTAGGTLGQGLTPLLLQPLIEAHGWRHAVLLLGALYLALLVPAMLLVRTPPARPRTGGPAPARAAAALPLPQGASIAWLSAAGTLCCVSMAVPVVHLVPLLADRGQPVSASAGLMLAIMLAASAGRLGFGLVADRIGAVNGYALAVAVQTVSMVWFTQWQGLPALYALAVAFGLGYGGVMTTLFLTVRAFVPARIAGTATALVTLFAWGGMAVGSWQGGACFDATGAYDTSFVAAAGAGLANLALLAAFALYRRRRARHAARCGHVWPAAIVAAAAGGRVP